MTENWHDAIAEPEFPMEGKVAVKLGGWHVLIARTETGFHAVNDRCTHQAAMISNGRVRRGAIMCPLHGARFEIETGRCIGGAYRDLRRFDLRVADGMLQVEVPDVPPGIEETPTGV